MAKKQTRKSISISAAAYARATDHAARGGISLSQLTERALEALEIGLPHRADLAAPPAIFGVADIRAATAVLEKNKISQNRDGMVGLGPSGFVSCPDTDAILSAAMADDLVIPPTVLVQMPDEWPRMPVRSIAPGEPIANCDPVPDDGVRVEYDEP